MSTPPSPPDSKTPVVSSDRLDGSLFHSLHYHFLKMTGGDVFGLGSGSESFDLWNKDSDYALRLQVAFTPYVFSSYVLTNILDPDDHPLDKDSTLTDEQKAVLTAAYNKKGWFYGSDKDHTADKIQSYLACFLGMQLSCKIKREMMSTLIITEILKFVYLIHCPPIHCG